MPTIIPSYVYSLFASLIVGTLIVGACGLSISGVKRQAEEQQLSGIASYVASKSMELVANVPTANLTASVWLELPSAVGGQRYWVQLSNDSSSSWVDVGFGATVIASGHRTHIPSDVSASGLFISGSNQALLRCDSDGDGIHLEILGDT